MNLRLFLTATGITAALLAGPAAHAEGSDCTADKTDPFDLTEADINALYDCMKDRMAEAYAKEGNEIAQQYRGWTVTGTRPGVAGAHGERLLLTFANPIAAPQYLKFEEDGVKMPAGSILAKESIKLGKGGKARIGPLFIMEKLEDGASPETMDWRYSAIQPNGKPMKVKQSFCHDCHVNWEAQDALAYPLPEVRVSAE